MTKLRNKDDIPLKITFASEAMDEEEGLRFLSRFIAKKIIVEEKGKTSDYQNTGSLQNITHSSSPQELKFDS